MNHPLISRLGFLFAGIYIVVAVGGYYLTWACGATVNGDPFESLGCAIFIVPILALNIVATPLVILISILDVPENIVMVLTFIVAAIIWYFIGTIVGMYRNNRKPQSPAS